MAQEKVKKSPDEILQTWIKESGEEVRVNMNPDNIAAAEENGWKLAEKAKTADDKKDAKK